MGLGLRRLVARSSSGAALRETGTTAFTGEVGGEAAMAGGVATTGAGAGGGGAAAEATGVGTTAGVAVGAGRALTLAACAAAGNRTAESAFRAWVEVVARVASLRREDQSSAAAELKSTTPNKIAAAELSLPYWREGWGVLRGETASADRLPVRFAITSPKLKLQVMRVR